MVARFVHLTLHCRYASPVIATPSAARFQRGNVSRAALRKINVTAGKEAVKGKVPEVERPKESWGNATNEKDQGLRKAGGPAKGRGAVLGMVQPGI